MNVDSSLKNKTNTDTYMKKILKNNQKLTTSRSQITVSFWEWTIRSHTYRGDNSWPLRCNNLFTSNADNFQLVYSDNPNATHPYYNGEGQRLNNGVEGLLHDLLCLELRQASIVRDLFYNLFFSHGSGLPFGIANWKRQIITVELP